MYSILGGVNILVQQAIMPESIILIYYLNVRDAETMKYNSTNNIYTDFAHFNAFVTAFNPPFTQTRFPDFASFLFF